MTTNQPDRLDRIEALLEGFIAASTRDRQENNERMKATDERLEAMDNRLMQLSEKTDARFNQLAEQQERMIAEADANRKVTFEMLSQLTTLQEESKRLLDYLFGQQQNGNGDQPQP